MNRRRFLETGVVHVALGTSALALAKDAPAAPPTSKNKRITYFLERVVLVAEANKVWPCLPPHDPGMPSGIRYVHRVLGSVDGLKRFVEIKASPYYGLNFVRERFPKYQSRLFEFSGNVPRRRRCGYASRPARINRWVTTG